MAGITSLVYATRNEIKFQVAAQVMLKSGITLTQSKLDVPEIQSPDVEDVARYSARWASQWLSQPVAVTDAGFFVEALNGFPGPFIKYVNLWFSAEDYLRLMEGKATRRVVIHECLAFCCPAQEPITFSTTHEGALAAKAGRNTGTAIDQIFIPAGRSCPISDIPADEMVDYWSNVSIWQRLSQYLVECEHGTE